MAQRNTRGRTTAVKDEEENKGSGAMPWVIGGLVGVAAGLLGSVLIDQVVEYVEAQEQETAQAHG